MTLEEKVNGNGHLDGDESQEDIETAFQVVNGQSRGDNTLITFAKNDMSLMQKMLVTNSDKYKEEQIWRFFEFLDDKEAMKHVNAYYEAQDLGMDTSFNIAYANSLVATNRRTGGTSLLSRLMDTLQHGKWASNQNVKARSNGTNPRSPLS